MRKGLLSDLSVIGIVEYICITTMLSKYGCQPSDTNLFTQT